MRKIYEDKVVTLGVCWQWGEGKRQGCLWLLTWGSHHKPLPSMESREGEGHMVEACVRVFRRQHAHMVGVDRGGLEDSGGTG